MEININSAAMVRDQENGYVGNVKFEVKGHKKPYEMMLQSKKGREWGYALTFLGASGPDDEIDALDQYLDENDEAYHRLIEAAMEGLTDGGNPAN